jgi:hypothetical protein
MLGDSREGEVGEGAPTVAAEVALLQTTGEDDGKQRAGHDAQLTLLRNGPGERPVGDADAHPALNDDRE